MSRWILWAFRLLAAGILLPVSVQKLVGGAMSASLFEALGMEPHGRIAIGMIELLAALLLLSRQAAIGALLAVCVMFGAIIAHVTVLGFEVGGDRGMLVMMLGVVLVAAATVLVALRRELPLVGSTLGDGGSGAAP